MKKEYKFLKNKKKSIDKRSFALQRKGIMPLPIELYPSGNCLRDVFFPSLLIWKCLQISSYFNRLSLIRFFLFFHLFIYFASKLIEYFLLELKIIIDKTIRSHENRLILYIFLFHFIFYLASLELGLFCFLIFFFLFASFFLFEFTKIIRCIE